MALCGARGGRGSGGGGGGARVAVVVVLVVVTVTVMASPAHCLALKNSSVFHLHKSCGSSAQLRHLAVSTSMWLRGTTEVTLVTQQNTSKPCLLPPNMTHHVTVSLHLEIHVAGAAGEEGEGRVCYFPKHAVFQLPRGALMVSCLPEKSQAEAEMLNAEESSSSTQSPVQPQPRALDPTAPPGTPQYTSTTLAPPASHEPLVASITPEPPKTRTDELSTTTMMVTGAVSFTKPPPLTDDRAMKTTLREQTTEIPDSTYEYLTEAATTYAADDTNTRSPTLASSSSNSSSTRETDLAEKLTPPPGTQDLDFRKGNTSHLGAPMKSEEHTPGEADDQVIFLAAAGSGVLALLVCVTAVAGVAHYRRIREAKAKEKDDLFMSGVRRGSMHSLNQGDSQGAYLNAHVMYSGAEPEFVESFELEERILKSRVSYSSHDIPKCLKES